MNALLIVGVAGAALVAALGVQTWRVDQLKADEVTWRLAAKDYEHAIGDLNLAIRIRDGRVVDRARSEADDAGAANSTCAADISSSFQKGVAVGRAIRHANDTPAPAAGQRPAPDGVRDYREAWARDAYSPGS
ncbi:hypothetical protein [Caulobacter sp. Root1472]|uniref:hypothetical protein n=1 Tax=Caulobacter sp. Root1472 TaxID=1736470 RepID=UPI0006FBD8C7|nr:hypothetical protein [Caulobacter sp. Root1472]KQZ31739.1 hypothetical protein ASD47_15825 [Caulobacter sp. Root1472]